MNSKKLVVEFVTVFAVALVTVKGIERRKQ